MRLILISDLYLLVGNSSLDLNLGILLLIPPISAIIGWLTNFLAVKMLFHPKEPITFLSIKIQGVFPKRQKELSNKLGILVSEELFSIQEISKQIRQHATSEEAMNAIGNKIEKTIRGKLVGTFPMLAMFLSDEMVEKVTVLFRKELQDFITESAETLTDNIEKKIDVKKMVTQKVAAFSSHELEKLLFNLMRKEFRFIEIIGAILGFAIGLAQVIIVLIS